MSRLALLPRRGSLSGGEQSGEQRQGHRSSRSSVHGGSSVGVESVSSDPLSPVPPPLVITARRTSLPVPSPCVSPLVLSPVSLMGNLASCVSDDVDPSKLAGRYNCCLEERVVPELPLRKHLRDCDEEDYKVLRAIWYEFDKDQDG